MNQEIEEVEVEVEICPVCKQYIDPEIGLSYISVTVKIEKTGEEFTTKRKECMSCCTLAMSLTKAKAKQQQQTTITKVEEK